jgi:predicted Zn-dependent protease
MLDQWLSPESWQSQVDEALRIAILNLQSVPTPAGEMEVVLGAGWPGVMLHEAVGHGLEGDFNRKGTSVFSGRVGQQVAAKGVTVIDDGTIADRRGSITVDDEGTPSRRNVLIEDGILKGYMQDRQNARLMGVDATGQWTARILCPCPNATHDQYLYGKWRCRPARDCCLDEKRHLCGEFWWRSGGYHIWQIRLFGGRGLSC